MAYLFPELHICCGLWLASANSFESTLKLQCPHHSPHIKLLTLELEPVEAAAMLKKDTNLVPSEAFASLLAE